MTTGKSLASILVLVCVLLAACSPVGQNVSATSMPVSPLGTATAEASTWPVEFVWSINGSPNPLSRPTRIAVDREDNIYVVDGGHQIVQKFDTNGKFLTMWGGEGDGNGQFVFLHNASHYGDVAVDGQGNVYVTDYNDRVQKFDGNGKFLMKFGAHGNGDGQFADFMFIAVDGRGNIYVSDSGNSRVQKFDSDGNFLMKWGSQGKGDGQFGSNISGSPSPWALAVDQQGNVYVLDSGNFRVEKFDGNGKFLAKWGGPGGGDGQFMGPDGPAGIAVDQQGNVYVTDSALGRVSKFDGDGKFLFKWGEPGTELGMFNYPDGIAVDKQGNIYVVNGIGANDVGGFVLKYRPK